MPRPQSHVVHLLLGVGLFATGVHADDWTTLGYDAQRSSWVRADAKTSPATVQGPDFQFLWRIDLPNQARGGNALTAPALLDFLISHKGFRSLAFVGGSSGGIFAMDTDLARMEWERQFPSGSSATSDECPGGMTANVSRPTSAAMPSMLGFGARGRRTPASSGVGRPGEGAVTLQEAASRSAPAAAPPAASGRTRPPARRALRGVTLVHALSASGALHTLYVSNGRDHVAPIPFLPPNSNADGLIVVDGVAYAATRNGCGGAADGVWSLDLESGEVSSWESTGGGVAGLGGFAIGPESTVYAATTGGPVVALEPGTLELQSESEAVGFRSSPVVLDVDGRDYVAAIGRNGSVLVYEAADLGRPIASSPAESGGAGSETAPATWRDTTGTRWILAPSGDSITAWKLTIDDGRGSLEKGWTSPAMDHPLPPIVVNGVVFALDGGDPSGTATLHALEGTNGRSLWNSGDSIGASARGHTLSSGPGHVFLTTSDSAVYAFGLPMEH